MMFDSKIMVYNNTVQHSRFFPSYITIIIICIYINLKFNLRQPNFGNTIWTIIQPYNFSSTLNNFYVPSSSNQNITTKSTDMFRELTGVVKN